MRPTRDATRENMQEAIGDLNKLIAGIGPVQTQLLSTSCDAPFRMAMGNFVTDDLKRLEDLKQAAATLQTNYKNLLVFYGEPPTTTTEEFFMMVNDFASALKKSIQDNRKRKEEAFKAVAREIAAEKAAIERAAAAAERTTNVEKTGNHNERISRGTSHYGTPESHKMVGRMPASPNTDSGTGELDKIINAMKNGRMFNERRVQKTSSIHNRTVRDIKEVKEAPEQLELEASDKKHKDHE